MEHAVAHGYLSATQSGYAEQRARARRGERKGLPDLARDMAKLGGAVVHTSAPDSPMAS